MSQLKDIEDKRDIELLVNTFYDKVKQDDTIGFIFNDIIGDDWSKHLPIMYNFWDMILLGNPGYAGSPIHKHIDVDKKIQLEEQHYTRWLVMWSETIDSLYKGDIAENAKTKAKTMMQLIDMKVQASRTGKSLF